MINNQWYAVWSSHEIHRGQVVGVRRFGENLVFFRNSDGVFGGLIYVPIEAHLFQRDV